MCVCKKFSPTLFKNANLLIRSSKLLLCNISTYIFYKDKESNLPCCTVVLLKFLMYFNYENERSTEQFVTINMQKHIYIWKTLSYTIILYSSP